MRACLKSFVSVITSISILALTPAPLFAASSADDQVEQLKNLEDLTVLAHYGEVDAKMPWLTELALGEPVVKGPLWNVPASNPLTDADPYFMRSQAWEKTNECSGDHFCVLKDGADVVLAQGDGQALRIKQPLRVVSETQEYVLLSPDDLGMFAAKTPNESKPGEGVFFIEKAEFASSAEHGYPVPIYFFVLPGSGWIGADRLGYENALSQEITLYNDEQFGLPIEVEDLALTAKAQRTNLLLLKTEAFLNNDIQPNGVAYPPPHSTLAFGLFLSQPKQKTAKQANAISLKRFGEMASHVGNSVLPAAHALDIPGVKDPKNTAVVGEELHQSREAMEQEAAEAKKNNIDWKNYISPALLFGGTGVLAYYLSEHIEVTDLITADIYPRLKTVGAIMGATMAASIAMKYTIHKETFDKKYPKYDGQPVTEKLKNEAKGIFDELAHGLYTVWSGVPQSMRHSLDFLKDRFAPDNRLVQRAWKATIEYDMKQNSKLAMNWKTFFYGAIIFGMADAGLVGIDLLVFTPIIAKYFGLTIGHATAAFATAEVMRNFLSYLMQGAHSYSHKIKTIEMDGARRDARRILRLEGKDPDDNRFKDRLEDLTNNELSKRYRAVGLPEKEEFLYDPLTILEKMMGLSGFRVNPDQITKEQQDALNKQGFLLRSRHWGLVKPSVKKALAAAERAQALNPSPKGAQVVNLLRWAAEDRNEVKSIFGRAWDSAASDWGRDEFDEAGRESLAAYLVDHPKNANTIGMAMATIKGKLKHIAVDSTRHVRDIRQVMFLASSTSDNPQQFAEYMPQSWKDKAGSDDVALAAAELVNRSFFSYVQEDPDKIKPSSDLEAKYGARADAVMSRIAAREPSLADPFLRQIRRDEIMHRLRVRDVRRNKVVNYTPDKIDKLGQRQWERIRDRATSVYDRLADDEATAGWNNIADRFALKSGAEIDRDSWVRSYRYRLIVAREFTQEVGLVTDDVENSDFVPKVIEAASLETEVVLKLENERAYQRTLSPEDLEFYQAQVFARIFRSKYVEMSVKSAPSEMSAASPEFPGIGQKIRRWLSPKYETGRFQAVRRHIIGTPVAHVTSRLVRTFESFFRNEESSYDVGVRASMERYVPFVPDLVKNGVRYARSLPYLLSFAYLTYYFVWQIQMPYALWMFFMVAGFPMSMVGEILGRAQRFHDKKPMQDIGQKLNYAWWWSRLTNPEIMAIQAFSQPAVGAINGVGSAAFGVIKGCGRLLLGR